MKIKIDMFPCQQGDDFAQPIVAHAMLAMEVKGIWRSFSKIRESASLSYEKLFQKRKHLFFFSYYEIRPEMESNGLL